MNEVRLCSYVLHNVAKPNIKDRQKTYCPCVNENVG